MNSSAVTGIARFASLLFSGIFAGFLVAVLVLEMSLRDYDGQVYAQVRQVELDALDMLAAVTLLPALIATAILAVSGRGGGRPFRLLLAAAVLLVVVIVTTFVFNLPINSDQADWDVQAPPSDWADDRDRWQSAHAVRTVLALVAFGCVCLATRATRATVARTVKPGAAARDESAATP